MYLTKGQIDILDYTKHRTANGLFCGDSKDMQVLVANGLMYRQGETGFCPDEYFGITVLGCKELSKDRAAENLLKDIEDGGYTEDRKRNGTF